MTEPTEYDEIDLDKLAEAYNGLIAKGIEREQAYGFVAAEATQAMTPVIIAEAVQATAAFSAAEAMEAVTARAAR